MIASPYAKPRITPPAEHPRVMLRRRDFDRGAANRNKAAQLLREFAGTNLYGYINDMRLEYARELMHERPNAPVKAISADAGFSNIRTFYRLFLSKYGTTPTNYRKSR